MKILPSFLTSVFFFLFLQLLSAQENVIVNGGFEEWEDVPGTIKQNPVGWFSSNKFYPNDSLRGIGKSLDAYSGNYSMELKAPVPEQGRDSVLIVGGLGSYNLQAGRIMPSELANHTGVPFDWQSGFEVSGYYKFTPNPLSKDSVFVYLVSVDDWYCHCGVYKSKTGFNSASDWTFFRLIAKKSGTFPGTTLEIDSLSLNFFYKSSNKDSGNTGYFRVDDLKIEPLGSGIDDEASQQLFSLFPNPTTGAFIIKMDGPFRFEIYNSLGELIDNGKGIDKYQGKLTPESPGVYLIKLINDKGVTVQRLLVEK